MKRIFASLAAVGFVFVLPGTVAGTAAASSLPKTESVIAIFEGHQLRLAESWGEATACISDQDEARCYRTGGELRKAEGLDELSLGILAACGTNLVLFSGTAYSGSQLYLSARGQFIGLSAYGFDNITSSYQVGACSARFYEGGGGSTQYPGSTSAGTWSSTMVSGWDNRISTVYIL